MKIPTHWSKATVEDADRDGRKRTISCWRSSDRSAEEAHESALAAAKRLLQRLAGGNRPEHYGYGSGPLREEVIERFTGEQGELYAAVTRNACGTLVLNTSRAMFVDVDFPPTGSGETLKHFFARLFNRSSQSPDAKREQDAKSRLERFVGDFPGWGFRVYRTFAGLRALATHDLFDPASEAALAAFQSLGADPLYVRLCKTQECFRARLTPKPWRCGHHANTIRWPREEAEQQARFEQWLAEYKSSQAGYATCRFLAAIGNAAVHPEVERIIELHDTITRCHEPGELA